MKGGLESATTFALGVEGCYAEPGDVGGLLDGRLQFRVGLVEVVVLDAVVGDELAYPSGLRHGPVVLEPFHLRPGGEADEDSRPGEGQGDGQRESRDQPELQA